MPSIAPYLISLYFILIILGIVIAAATDFIIADFLLVIFMKYGWIINHHFKLLLVSLKIDYLLEIGASLSFFSSHPFFIVSKFSMNDAITNTVNFHSTMNENYQLMMTAIMKYLYKR